MNYLSIRIKLLLLTLIILVPLIILQSINIYENFQQETKQKLEVSAGLADAVSESFVNYIQQLWIQESLVTSHIIDNLNNANNIQSYLQTIVNTNGNELERLSFANADGVIIASSRQYMIGQSLAGRDYYKEIKAGKDAVVSNLIVSYVDGKLIIPVCRAVRKDGKLLGTLIYSVDSNKIISHIPNLQLNKGETLCIIDSSGNIVYNSSNNNLPFNERKIGKDAPAWQALQGKVVENSYGKVDFDNRYYMSVDYPIKELGWVCSISSPKDMVLANDYGQATKSFIILVLVSIISLIASHILSIKITKPLVLLKNKAEHLKLGDYSVRANIGGSDEIALTAQAFDHMADSMEQYDKLKSQFFSNLSHEFKTPINVIYSSVQVMENFNESLTCEEFKNKTMQYSKIIRQNCYRLMKISDNMIDVTRYDTGNFRMNAYNNDIVTIVENICLSVVKYAEQKGVTIIFDTEFEEKIIGCDPYMIERIMLNLISNALKFTDSNGFIYVNIYDREDKVIISVKDTGIGIPKDKLSIIFDRFRQVDTSLNRNHEGSGLGLSIVKALVEAHNGTISVNSELGIGTEFIIELPSNALNDTSNENNKPVFESKSDTIRKIPIEFSDIYSINNNFVE